MVDESCQTLVDRVWNIKASSWVYVLSKLLSEEAAFQYANEYGIDLISVIPTTVAGPFLTPKVPASVRVLLSAVTGDHELYSILHAVHTRLGPISLVHIEDIYNTHIFLMEQAAAKGRYICSTNSCVMAQLVDRLTQKYPHLVIIVRFSEKDEGCSVPSKISSKKLTDLGFEYKYGLTEIIQESVSCCVHNGYLNQPGKP
ncbi:hypothetical protein GIB67_039906 [Kingdonia uniflora]|uniref:NAD-dependent epimerase/dehydratase domain-containing protein n=1 Tax=Kingdonia uniflora TaxID=39325 RepID=A0A7J7P3E8_9MAGN|nr:hypothetical protein GIB67_039906 [Kingdonia uniflora]